MQLDESSGLPPFRLVADELRRAIQAGTYAPGEQLPAGTRLAEEFGVSRMTINNAMRVLKDDGLVVGRSGSGVYVRADASFLDRALAGQGIRWTGGVGRRRVSDLYGVPAEELPGRVEALAADFLREQLPLTIRAIVPAKRLGLEELHVDARRLGMSSLRAESRAVALVLMQLEIDTAQVALCYALTAPDLKFTLHRTVEQLALRSPEGAGPRFRDTLRTPKEPEDKMRAGWFDQQWAALSTLAQTSRP